MPQNKQFKLAKRPVGTPKQEDWEFVTSHIPQPKDGEVLIGVHYVSLDPAMRGWMNDSKSYLPPVGIGEVMRAGTVGKVIESKHPKYAVGDFVRGMQGVQQYGISDGTYLSKIDPNLVPLPYYLSVLGMTGMTAYFGLLEIGLPKEGEVVLVSGAAGAVGSLVGQIAKIKGCQTIGIAGGEKKVQYCLDELGYDACIDYKNEDVKTALKKYAPKGIDIYFDNVGGEILDIALSHIKLGARIPLCGAISQYNATTEAYAPKNYLSLLINRARMEGFIVLDFAKKYKEAGMQMAQWMQQGKLKNKEHIVEGIETFPERLMMLFTGENFGKLVLKVKE